MVVVSMLRWGRSGGGYNLLLKIQSYTYNSIHFRTRLFILSLHYTSKIRISEIWKKYAPGNF